MSGITVLCVDGDDRARQATADALSDDETTVVAVSGVAEASTALADNESEIDCVVTEYELGDGTGLDLLAEIRSTAPDTPCILFTEYGPEAIETEAFEGLVVEYLQKGGERERSRLRELVAKIVTLRSQVGYPLPDDEDARLAALAQYDISDRKARETFDRLTQLAKIYFETDRAFIGLVAEHEERFISCYGGRLNPLERQSTMCTYAILEDDVLVVEDVKDDDRFKHNAELTRLNIRSYLGAPLRTPEDAAIGSLCVTHDEPRTYSDTEITYLRLLADEAMEQLELRRRLQATEQAGGSGS